MIEVQAKNLDKVAKRFSDFPAAMKVDMEKWLTWAVFRVLREAKILATNRVLKVRTGGFRAAITQKIDKAKMEGRVGTKHPGARLLEYGGTIQPKKAKFLAIPLPGAETKAGVRRKPRDYTGTFFVKTSTGLVLMGSRVAGAKAEPLFAMKRSATIKPKRLFELTAKTTFPLISRQAEVTVESTIDRKLSD